MEKYVKIIKKIEKINEYYQCINCDEINKEKYTCSCSKCNENHEYKEYVEITNYYDNLPNALMFGLYLKCKKCNVIKWNNQKKYQESYISNYKNDPVRIKLFYLLKELRTKEDK